MKKLSPYINYNGNCEEAFNFYKDIFTGSEFETVMRFKDLPEDDEASYSEEDAEKIMHITLKIGEIELFGSDMPQSWGAVSIGDNISISISLDSKDEADRVFKELSNGGEEQMPLQDQFWGTYFGIAKDKFGVNWMINFDYPQSE